MSKFESKCPCIDLVRCGNCAKKICYEIHNANIHSCFPVKNKDYVCGECTEEILNEK